jgi:hypothetical protein
MVSLVFVDPTAVVVWLAGLATDWQQRRRHVRVMVHRANFQVPGAPECFFIKVTNLSSSREIEVTHIWFGTELRIDVPNQERRLPARLRLDETFETWIPVSAVPAVRHVESKVRVRLSNGKVIKSKLDKRIPPLGYVAGPGSQ